MRDLAYPRALGDRMSYRKRRSLGNNRVVPSSAWVP